MLPKKLTLEKIEELQNVKMLSTLITDNRITMFAANAGEGKTSVVLGQLKEINDLYKNKQILYFDYDQGIHRTTTELLEVALNYSDIRQVDTIPEHVSVMSYIDSIPAKMNTVLVFDGFQSFVGKYNGKYDINKAHDMQIVMGIFKRLRKEGFTVIIIHHNNKEDPRTGNSLFRGSSVIQDSLDSLFYVKGVISDSKLNIVLSVEKFSGQNLYKGTILCFKQLSNGDVKYADSTAKASIVYPKNVDKVQLIKCVVDMCGSNKSNIAKDIKTRLSIGLNKAVICLNLLIEEGLFKAVPTGKKNSFTIHDSSYKTELIEAKPIPTVSFDGFNNGLEKRIRRLTDALIKCQYDEQQFTILKQSIVDDEAERVRLKIGELYESLTI